MSTNTLEEANMLRTLQSFIARIEAIEGMLQGRQISIARIKDATITNAKITDLSADKLTSGQLAVTTDIDIGDPTSGNYIHESGGDVQIVMYKSSVAQLVIGRP